MAKRSLLERAMDLLVPEPNTGCWLMTGERDKRYYQARLAKQAASQ